jgi:hypothetical protein
MLLLFYTPLVVKLNTERTLTMTTDRPASAVNINEKEYLPRNGDERVNDLPNITNPDTGEVVECFAIWPSNKLSKSTPEHGPFPGQEGSKRWLYWTHVLPDSDGVFAPARYDIYPPTLRDRINEKQERLANLPSALKDLIAAQRRSF